MVFLSGGRDRDRIRSELEQRPSELLERLKSVKVDSADYQQKVESKRALPELREEFESPLYGYEEPKVIPDGKCTLAQALQFIANHQNDPKQHDIQSIARGYKLKTEDVYNIIKNFKVFHVYIARDQKTSLAKSDLSVLGAGKIIEAKYKPKFTRLELEGKESDKTVIKDK